MCVYIYIYIYIYTYAYIYIYTHIHIHIPYTININTTHNICVYVCIYTYIYIYMNMYMHLYMHISLSPYIYIYTYMSTCLSLYIYIYTQNVDVDPRGESAIRLPALRGVRLSPPWEQIITPLSRCHPDRLTIKPRRKTVFVRMPRGCSSDQPRVMVGISGWSAFSGVCICF